MDGPAAVRLGVPVEEGSAGLGQIACDDAKRVVTAIGLLVGRLGRVVDGVVDGGANEVGVGIDGDLAAIAAVAFVIDLMASRFPTGLTTFPPS